MVPSVQKGGSPTWARKEIKNKEEILAQLGHMAAKRGSHCQLQTAAKRGFPGRSRKQSRWLGHLEDSPKVSGVSLDFGYPAQTRIAPAPKLHIGRNQVGTKGRCQIRDKWMVVLTGWETCATCYSWKTNYHQLPPGHSPSGIQNCWFTQSQIWHPSTRQYCHMCPGIPLVYK